MAKLSVNDFRKLLKEQVGKICAERGWNPDNATEKGYGFQTWLAEVVARYEVGLEDVEPDDALLYSRDLGVDFVMEDPNRQQILICQAKYQGFDKPVDEKEVNDFFNRHEHLARRTWVIKNGSDRATELLADYGEKISAGYSATFYFVSTGSASDRVSTIAETANSSYASRGLPVRCDLYDFSRLKDYYIRSLSLEESGPREVVLRLPRGRFFEKPDPFPTVVAAIKGNELRRLYQTHKESLYVWNIRGYLGNRGINHDIFNTAESQPDCFFYYNNGVSAICTNYEIRNENEIWAENLQIINGAQTVSTLAKAAPNQELDVLFRLTRAASVKTEKGFNREIIRYNNTQNSIKVSDFRANDEIQLWLEERFKNCKATAVIPDMFYLRKRAVGRRGTGWGLKLEEMAKIRYSFLQEPTLVHASPKSLWSLKDDDGAYEVAFGVEGELSPIWTDETFNEALFGVALYLRISDETSQLGKRTPELRYFRRLRFHALSLAGVFWREKRPAMTPKMLLHNKAAFDSLWQEFWSIASGILIDVHSTAMEQGVTMFAFVRSEERWEQMRKRLRLRLAVSAD